jgi:hypothetical protein
VAEQRASLCDFYSVVFAKAACDFTEFFTFFLLEVAPFELAAIPLFNRLYQKMFRFLSIGGTIHYA